MIMKSILLTIAFIVLTIIPSEAQIKIANRHNPFHGIRKGFYTDDHSASAYQSEVPTKQKLGQIFRDDSLDIGTKTYRFATAIGINIDFIQSANWIEKGSMTYGRLLIVASGAKSLSLNFNSFLFRI